LRGSQLSPKKDIRAPNVNFFIEAGCDVQADGQPNRAENPGKGAERSNVTGSYALGLSPLTTRRRATSTRDACALGKYCLLRGGCFFASRYIGSATKDLIRRIRTPVPRTLGRSLSRPRRSACRKSADRPNENAVAGIETPPRQRARSPQQRARLPAERNAVLYNAHALLRIVHVYHKNFFLSGRTRRRYPTRKNRPQ
jgi:hypothetical protein